MRKDGFVLNLSENYLLARHCILIIGVT